MKKLLLFLCLTTICVHIKANNIAVTNASLSGQNTINHTQVISFDVAWDNGWRTSTNENNYDGAWIFIKFRKNGTGDWRHATINNTGFTAGSGAAFSVPADQKGAFIYRSTDGIGNSSFTGNQLIWNYGADSQLDNETFEIKIFAVEMVYIPQGSFQLGSGGTEVNCFKTGATTDPYNVTAATINFSATGASDLNTNGNGPTTGSLPINYATGFNAFWIMKYETSEQQFADFLNHIDLARATANNVAGFVIAQHPSIIAPFPERAVASINTQRLAAQADWSGLRPFTELEYEKACRGYNTFAVPNEYAWGNTSFYNLNIISNTGLANETVTSPANANAAISGFSAPFRVGIFARSTGATRALSGATYYGVMNMSDNVYEICVNMVTATGLAFNGTIHGDGYLSSTGATNITNWNNYNSYGYRGSSFNTALSLGRLSDRANANIFPSFGSDYLNPSSGSRLARTAP
jgi:formylglycine-generating enzyme required for sulfatase activity